VDLARRSSGSSSRYIRMLYSIEDAINVISSRVIDRECPMIELDLFTCLCVSGNVDHVKP
jgi:hypothetical protein